MAKDFQNYVEMEIEIQAFLQLFEKVPKGKIALPLVREHDFTSFEHLEADETPIQNTHRIDARKAAEEVRKMVTKWSPNGSLDLYKINQNSE